MLKQKFRFKKAEIGNFINLPDEIFEGFQPGDRVMGLTRGEFSLIDIIHSALKYAGPANVLICTWSAGIKDAHNVKWMMDSQLIGSFRIITDHSFATRKPKYLLPLDELFGKENIRTSEIHAKFTLIWNDDHKICIRHSMNLNANRTCESFEIDDDFEVFDFYRKFAAHHFKYLPDGFTRESSAVNKCLDRYFGKTTPPPKHWSES